MSKASGWGWPVNSKKAHFFVGGMSLCRKWAFLGKDLEEGKDNSPDNCAECRRRKAKWDKEQADA